MLSYSISFDLDNLNHRLLSISITVCDGGSVLEEFVKDEDVNMLCLLSANAQFSIH